MTFDEQVKNTLEEHSQWPGSADELWGKISSQLDNEKRAWQKRPFWLGTAVAALLFVALFAQTVLSPLPSETPEVQDLSKMQTFSAVMFVEELQSVQAKEEIEIDLDIFLAVEEQSEYATLVIWRLGENDQNVMAEHVLDATELLTQRKLIIEAPEESGTYRLVVEGVAREEEQIYQIYGEKTILVGS